MAAYDGSGPRDGACYSIVAGEWPAVRERLSALLAHRPAAVRPSA